MAPPVCHWCFVPDNEVGPLHESGKVGVQGDAASTGTQCCQRWEVGM